MSIVASVSSSSSASSLDDFGILNAAVGNIQRGVLNREHRLFTRALRTLIVIRKRLSGPLLVRAVNQAFGLDDEGSSAAKGSEGIDCRDDIVVAMENSLILKEEIVESNSSSSATLSTSGESTSDRDVDKEDQSNNGKSEATSSSESSSVQLYVCREPEVELFFRLLLVVALLDQSHVAEAYNAAEKAASFLETNDRHTMDVFGARVFYYLGRCCELMKTSQSIRGRLHAALRTATLRRNIFRQATLTTTLLRGYVRGKQFDQALKFAQLSVPEQMLETFPVNELARYHFYMGKINAVQLKYSDAFDHLSIALRKAPYSSARAFRAQVTKFLCLVQLLMGDIPDRDIFLRADLRTTLLPYLELTQVVRKGDVQQFQDVLQFYAHVFHKDDTFSLVQRTRTNVIKTGLRRINIAYSRLSFDDICSKLGLTSLETAEGIVAKAIRDGVIDAVIDHENSWVRSLEQSDVYLTSEPHVAFHKRTNFCLKIHNEAVKAMRFPDDEEHARRVKEAEEQQLQRAKEDKELIESGALDEDGDDDLL